MSTRIVGKPQGTQPLKGVEIVSKEDILSYAMDLAHAERRGRQAERRRILRVLRAIPMHEDEYKMLVRAIKARDNTR